MWQPVATNKCDVWLLFYFFQCMRISALAVLTAYRIIDSFMLFCMDAELFCSCNTATDHRLLSYLFSRPFVCVCVCLISFSIRAHADFLYFCLCLNLTISYMRVCFFFIAHSSAHIYLFYLLIFILVAVFVFH